MAIKMSSDGAIIFGAAVEARTFHPLRDGVSPCPSPSYYGARGIIIMRTILAVAALSITLHCFSRARHF
jgi:hypothetical protein